MIGTLIYYLKMIIKSYWIKSVAREDLNHDENVEDKSYYTVYIDDYNDDDN